MLGLRVTPKSKHAVIYTGSREGEYHFLNNKHQNSPEPEILRLTESDLLSRLDETVTMLELLAKEQLASSLRTVRTQFMKAVKESRPAVLSSHLNMPLLTTAMTEYAQLIVAEMETICR